MFETTIAVSVALSLLVVAVLDFADASAARRRAQAAVRPINKAVTVVAPKAANEAEVPTLPKAA